MKKFDILVNEVYTKILSEAPPAPGLDQTGGNPPPPAPGAAAPAPEPAASAAPAPEEAPKPVSSEGLRNLVDLIQRALVISPDSIEKQELLSDIIDRINPPQSEVEG